MERALADSNFAIQSCGCPSNIKANIIYYKNLSALPTTNIRSRVVFLIRLRARGNAPILAQIEKLVKIVQNEKAFFFIIITCVCVCVFGYILMFIDFFFFCWIIADRCRAFLFDSGKPPLVVRAHARRMAYWHRTVKCYIGAAGYGLKRIMFPVGPIIIDKVRSFDGDVCTNKRVRTCVREQTREVYNLVQNKKKLAPSVQ